MTRIRTVVNGIIIALLPVIIYVVGLVLENFGKKVNSFKNIGWTLMPYFAIVGFIIIIIGFFQRGPFSSRERARVVQHHQVIERERMLHEMRKQEAKVRKR